MVLSFKPPTCPEIKSSAFLDFQARCFSRCAYWVAAIICSHFQEWDSKELIHSLQSSKAMIGYTFLSHLIFILQQRFGKATVWLIQKLDTTLPHILLQSCRHSLVNNNSLLEWCVVCLLIGNQALKVQHSFSSSSIWRVIQESYADFQASTGLWPQIWRRCTLVLHFWRHWRRFRLCRPISFDTSLVILGLSLSRLINEHILVDSLTSCTSMPQHIAKGIALGQLDPFTQLPFQVQYDDFSIFIISPWLSSWRWFLDLLSCFLKWIGWGCHS